ncbi:MFS transporter [Clostridium paraputrificum]
MGKKYSKYLLISSLGGNVLGSTFVLFLSSIKGYTIKETSIIIGITPMIILPAFFLWGPIIDKYRKVILFTKLVHFANISTMILMIIIKNFWSFFFVNLIRGILLQPGGGLSDKYLLFLSKDNEISYGKVRVFSTVGFGATGIISPILISLFGVTITIVVGMMLILVSIFLLNLIPELNEDVYIRKDKENKDSWLSMKKILKNKIFIKYLTIISIINGTQGAASGYGLQSMLLSLEAPEALVGSIPFMMIIFEIIILLIFDRIKFFENRDNVLWVALWILIVRWGLMIFASSYVSILLITTMHGLVAGGMLQVQNRIVGEIVPNNQQFSAFMLLGAISGTILPSLLNLITGNLYESLGIVVFGGSYFILTSIAIFIMLSFEKNRIK